MYALLLVSPFKWTSIVLCHCVFCCVVVVLSRRVRSYQSCTDGAAEPVYQED